MKVTYYEIIWQKKAHYKYNRCPSCGSRNYEMIHQLEPKDYWYVKCMACGREGLPSKDKGTAKGRWTPL